MVSLKSLAAAALQLVAADPFSQKSSSAKTIALPNRVFDGETKVELVHEAGVTALDGQKVRPYPNSSTWEWWYFDAVAHGNPNKTTAIIFNDAIPSAFMGGRFDSPLSIAIIGTHDNGQMYNYSIPMSDTSEAVVAISPDNGDVQGDFGDSYCWFKGTKGMGEYVVNIESPDNAIHGTVKLKSRAPAHYACALHDVPHTTQEILPTVGWSNAVPEAEAEVHLHFGDGTSLHFEGTGYHDKNWGEIPFFSASRAWYWGHARLGPYAIVWFDALGQPAVDNAHETSGYIAKDGVPIHVGCAKDAVRVRPFGGDDRYPPMQGWTLPLGYDIEYKFEDENGAQKTFKARITRDNIMTQVPVYMRYAGVIKGGIVGEEVFEGVGLGEQFAVSGDGGFLDPKPEEPEDQGHQEL